MTLVWLIIKVVARKECSDWPDRCCFIPLPHLSLIQLKQPRNNMLPPEDVIFEIDLVSKTSNYSSPNHLRWINHKLKLGGFEYLCLMDERSTCMPQSPRHQTCECSPWVFETKFHKQYCSQYNTKITLETSIKLK